MQGSDNLHFQGVHREMRVRGIFHETKADRHMTMDKVSAEVPGSAYTCRRFMRSLTHHVAGGATLFVSKEEQQSCCNDGASAQLQGGISHAKPPQSGG